MATTPPDGGAGAMLRQAQDALSNDRLDEATEHAEAALRAARELGNTSVEAGALVVLGQTFLRRDQAGEAAICFEGSLAILGARGDRDEAAVVKQALVLARARAELAETPLATAVDPSITLSAATAALASGSPEEALSLIRAAMPAFFMNLEALSMARAVEARALQRMGHYEEALRILEQALAAAAEAGLKEHVDGLRNLERRLRQTVGLRRVAGMSVLELERSTEDPVKLSALLMQKALNAVAEKDKDEARRLMAKARIAAEASEKPVALLQALVNAAQIFGTIGDVGEAKKMLAEARPLAKEHSPGVMGAIEEIERGLGERAYGPPRP